jgi:apolipoprotein N-acyltransferase
MRFVGMTYLSFYDSLASLFDVYGATLRRSTGWRRVCITFVCGSIMALSMPPFDCFPLLWIGLPALIFLLQGTQTYKDAFIVGWCFAFGFFVCSLYWIAAAMFVDIKTFWWAVPLAVAGLPAYFAIYYGIAAVLARQIGLVDVAGILAFGLLWFLADYARGHMFTGFPWNLVGYTWSATLPILQVASLIGIYGLSLITTVVATLPACLIERSRSRYTLLSISLILFGVLAVGGELRLQTTQVGIVPDVRLRLVQPDISQANKWRIEDRDGYFQDLLKMTAAPAQIPVTDIIWPETASTYYLGEDPEHRQALADQIPPGATVLTGVIRHAWNLDGSTRYYNSLIAVNGSGTIIAGYDKSHLVPFGEFMPLRKYIPLRTLAASGVDFTPGNGVRSLRVPGLPPFSPLICYEAIFPGAVVDRDDRPDFMLNATNDGWYGKTIGPYQHFAIVRVRAIEEGLPLVRAANTGISGIVDPLGHVKVRLGLGKKGFIDGDLPTPLPPTFFSQWREFPLWSLFTLLVMTFGYCRRYKYLKSKPSL